jgi:DNA-binding CsgD family transcriptional regulator
VFANPEQAFGGSTRMLEMIESIYAAAQDATLWPSVIAQISAVVRGESVALYAGFPDARARDLFALANTSIDTWNPFAEYYVSVNPLMQRGEATLSPDVPWSSSAVIEDAEFERTEFYADYYRPNGMYYSLGARLEFKDSPSASLSVQRPKGTGPFGEREHLIFATLMPHLRRSLMLHSRMSELQAEALGFELALDAYDYAVVGFDSSGRIILCNRRAQDLIASGDGVCSHSGRLRSSSRRDDSQLQRLIASALSSCHLEPAAGAIAIPAKNPKDELFVTVFPVTRSLAGRSLPLAALAFISDCRSASSRRFTLKQLYGLTPTEIRVTDLLMQGLDAREIGEKLKITLQTARFQIKRILAKTGARRQSELLRLMLSLPSIPT